MSAPAITLRVELPIDADAECWLAGAGVVARESAARTIERVHADGFYDDRCYRVLVAAARRYEAGLGEGIDTDIAVIADAANVEPALVRAWTLAPRPVFADDSGTVAAEAVEVAARRTQVFELLDALGELGVVGGEMP